MKTCSPTVVSTWTKVLETACSEHLNGPSCPLAKGGQGECPRPRWVLLLLVVGEEQRVYKEKTKPALLILVG